MSNIGELRKLLREKTERKTHLDGQIKYMTYEMDSQGFDFDYDTRICWNRAIVKMKAEIQQLRVDITSLKRSIVQTPVTK
jgi:hypothetical protein